MTGFGRGRDWITGGRICAVGIKASGLNGGHPTRAKTVGSSHSIDFQQLLVKSGGGCPPRAETLPILPNPIK